MSAANDNRVPGAIALGSGVVADWFTPFGRVIAAATPATGLVRCAPAAGAMPCCDGLALISARAGVGGGHGAILILRTVPASSGKLLSDTGHGAMARVRAARAAYCASDAAALAAAATRFSQQGNA